MNPKPCTEPDYVKCILYQRSVHVTMSDSTVNISYVLSRKWHENLLNEIWSLLICVCSIDVG